MTSSVLGAEGIDGTTRAADNAPTSLGPPGTYGASGRAAVPIEGSLVPIDLGDGRASVADEVFADAWAAANPAPPPAATGATAGAPGAWTPAGAAAPADLASCPALTGQPAWTTGQYALLADGTSHVHWSGAAWAAGDAP